MGEESEKQSQSSNYNRINPWSSSWRITVTDRPNVNIGEKKKHVNLVKKIANT